MNSYKNFIYKNFEMSSHKLGKGKILDYSWFFNFEKNIFVCEWYLLSIKLTETFYFDNI